MDRARLRSRTGTGLRLAGEQLLSLSGRLKPSPGAMGGPAGNGASEAGRPPADPDGGRSFYDLFGQVPLADLMKSADPVEVTGEWARLPPAAFLEFCRSYPRTDFDTIPSSPQQIQPPTFLISQAHRIWLLAQQVMGSLEATSGARLVDIGSFPYAVPLVVRDFCGFKGKIVATANLPRSEAADRFLSDRGIAVHDLELDPFVHPADSPTLPQQLPLEDGSVDVILLSHVIEHLYHPMPALKECARLLRPGGELIATTDNAMDIATLLNWIGNEGFVFEPVEGTAAMTFSFWRGHVRFFTRKDLESMLAASGLEVGQVKYHQVFYDVSFDDYFRESTPRLTSWKNDLLQAFPQFRNDITVVARKPAHSRTG